MIHKRSARPLLRALVLASALALLLIPSPSPAGKRDVQVMDKIICTVSRAVITLEQIDVEKEILPMSRDAVLYSRREGAMSRNKVLQELIARRLLLNAAVKMGFSKVPDQDIEKAMSDFRARFASDAAYRRFLKHLGLRDSLLQKESKNKNATDIVYRFRNRIMVSTFVEKKLEIQVKLALDDTYRKRRDALMSQYPEKSEDELKNFTRRSLHSIKLRAWLRELASRERIVILDERFKDDLEALLGLGIPK